MFARHLFVGCLTLVLLTRTVHCLYVDAALCAAAVASQSVTPPLADPTESDPNESGCICKGALLGTACLLADLRLESKLPSPATITLSIATPSTATLVIGPQSDPTALVSLSPPALSGRAVRALLASWRI
jgi:hypothetical protein